VAAAWWAGPAAALIREINSIGARIRMPRDLSSLELERVEVSAGIFARGRFGGAIAGGQIGD